jgi:propionate CoA-transferase
MRLKKIIEVADAVAVIHAGDTVASAGYAGSGTPAQLFVSIEQRFLETGTPRDLTLVFSTGQGDSAEGSNGARGIGAPRDRRLFRAVAEAGEAHRRQPHRGVQPARGRADAVVSRHRRAQARPALRGLGTTSIRARAGPDERAHHRHTCADDDGEEFLFYKAFPINVALIRGTTADPDGNITTERESLALENLALAVAARNSGGIVIAQVERVAAEGTLAARSITIPGILVDCVVLAEADHHMQTYGTPFNPAFSGELREPPRRVHAAALSERKVIARRAVLELAPNSVINVGVGSIPDQVPLVAGEERVQDLLSLVVDSGVIGGVPMGGLDFGAASNYEAVIEHACAFDFIDGGGLDAAFLGFGECDAQGNVNASKFGKRTPGCGGFIDISQNAKKVVFMGTFSSGGLEVAIDDGAVRIVTEGRNPKFVEIADASARTMPPWAERS